MRRSISKTIALYVCAIFAVQAFGQNVDDNTQKLKMFKEAAAKVPFCQALPFDVSKSILLNDGNPVINPGAMAANPGAMNQFMSDVNMKFLMQKCIAAISNNNEEIGVRDQVNDGLMNSIRNAAKRFVMSIAALAGKSKDNSIATIGIRG